jgi:hypothetical protein
MLSSRISYGVSGKFPYFAADKRGLRVKERVKREGDFTDNSRISIYLVGIRRVYHKT